MSLNLQPLPPFVPGVNPSDAWTSWRRNFLYYLKALKYHQEDQDIQIALFLQVCGSELSQLYHTLPLANVATTTLNNVLEALDSHFAPFKNLTLASFLFHRITQQPGQPFDQFLTALKLQAQECDFAEAHDRILKDRIIQGIQDQALQERLLREGTISLQKVIAQCQAAEASKLHASAMSPPTDSMSSSVNAVRTRTLIPHGGSSRQKKQNNNNRVPEPATDTQTRKFTNPCSRCGTFHAKRKCPAYGSRCLNCNMQNHWAKVCRQPKKQHKQQGMHSLNCDNVDTTEDTDDQLFLSELTVYSVDTNFSEWFETICVQDIAVDFKLDTGAQVNILPYTIYQQLPGDLSIRPTHLRVSTYTGEQLSLLGEVTLSCAHTAGHHNLLFLLTDVPAAPILGLPACEQLGLVFRSQLKNVPSKPTTVNQLAAEKSPLETPESIIDEFQDLFEGQGKLPGQYHIVLQEGAQPHVAPPRRIPAALEQSVREELISMERNGIITRVDEPTDWVNSMVVVHKPQGLRICLDPRPLNKVIKRNHYPLPNPDTLFAKLAGSKVFSLFDAKQGFWQMELDEPSSYLTTFITPYGRYRFLVLPYGLSCAPEAFQMAMDRLFVAEPDINPYIDDILLNSEDTPSHCPVLRRMLTISRKAGLRFNRRKLRLAVKEVLYLGHHLSASGMAADPLKLESIANFPTPTDRQELLRFLGLCTYLLKFIPDYSQHTFQLRSLLKKDTPWLWDTNMQTEFDKLKSLLASPPTLRFFDPSKPIVLSVDASSFGLGAVLLQDSHPVLYASASLTSTEQKYSQIEKELLASVYALDRFHYYVYGRPVTVQTDHKPLLGLSGKPYQNVTPRLQRLLLRLQKFDVTFEYVPGKQLIVADALSRAPVSNTIPEHLQFNGPFSVCLVAQATPVKLELIKTETISDLELQAVITHITNGWPEDKHKVHRLALPYWPLRDELHFTDGLLCRGNCLVIPVNLRQNVLERLHTSHRGVVSCKNKAREALYWPGMAKQIEDYIAKCAICQKHQAIPQQEPLYDVPIPNRPWEKLSMDFFHCHQKTFLLVIDNYSKFVEVIEMSTTSATAVIKVLKSLFARFGYPTTIMSDNGPPFTSSDLAAFFESTNITHTTSSPLFPRANGLVERAVRTIKSSLQKTIEAGGDIFQVLLDYRSTPFGDLPSPAEMLMGRKLQTQVPILPKQLKPRFPTKDIASALRDRQTRQHTYADKGTKRLPPLHVGQNIWFWTGSVWAPGSVISCDPNPRSYQIRSQDGKTLRRNRVHLRPRYTNNDNRSVTAEDYFVTSDSDSSQIVNQNDIRKTRYGRQIIPPRRYPD